MKANKKASCKVDAYVDYLDSWKGSEIWLPPNKQFTLVIDYPCKQTEFEFNTGKGMGLLGVLKQIGKAYKKIYESPDKYQVWGYSIGLVVEQIDINYSSRRIVLFVGS